MVPSKNVEGAIKLMAELLKSPRFSNDDLANERPVVLDELHRNESDPEQQLSRHVERALWGASWNRKDVAGDSGSLAGITVDRLNQTYGRFYIPNNAALIVTGDVSSDRVFEEARHRFGDWKRGPDPFVDRPIPPMAPRIMSTAVILEHDVPDVTIRIAMQGPSVGQDTAATYAADALFEVLNDPSSAFQRVLVDSGLFQSVAGYYLTLSHTGPIEIVGRTTAERAQDALAALVTELDNLDALGWGRGRPAAPNGCTRAGGPGDEQRGRHSNHVVPSLRRPGHPAREPGHRRRGGAPLPARRYAAAHRAHGGHRGLVSQSRGLWHGAVQGRRGPPCDGSHGVCCGPRP